MFASLALCMHVVHIVCALLGQELVILGKPTESSVAYYLFLH